MPDDPNIALAHAFVEAFDRADLDGIAACLSEDLVAEVTQKDADTIELHGRAAYMASVEALDIPTVRPRVWTTQVAMVSEDQVLFMTEVQVDRKGRHLHNFAAFLCTISENLIQRIWMVEARPAESDEFWKS